MCDCLCVVRPDGVLFAKSSDRPLGEVQVVERFARRPPGGRRSLATQYLTLQDPGASSFIGARPTWLWGVEHGVNEHRVAIGNERIWTVDDADRLPPALLGMDLVRLGLERATTATGALEVITGLLEVHGQGGVGELPTGEAYFSSFLIADPESAWVLETSDRTWVARRLDGGRGAQAVSLSNRVVTGTNWDRSSSDVAPGTDFQQWRDPDYPTPHADQRLAVTGAAASADPPPTAADIAAALRHHGGHPWGVPGATDPGPVDPLPGSAVRRDGTGVSVCMHLRGWEATTGSMIVSLPRAAERPVRAWAALGNPCVGVFVPIFPPDPPPPGLASPELWLRFAALKARVEAARDVDTPDRGEAALEQVRARLAPVEAALWADADEAAGGPTDARTRFVASVDERLRLVLDDLGV